MLHAIVMAGGSGTRFWPESRTRWPKQLLKLVGDRSLIQSTIDRVEGVAPPERILVLTSEVLMASIAQQLPQLSQQSILGEPCKRDTAPCIGLAAMLVARDDPEAVMLVMPSDHVIRDAAAFRRAVQAAEQLVREEPERIITFGIRPTYPAESFGYIERGEPIAESTTELRDIQAFKVKQFREKPKADVARQYVASGQFYWNSGIFVWRASTILDALARFQPEMCEKLRAIASSAGKTSFQQVFRDNFSQIRGISIDYAVMEHASNLVVIEAPFDWDDVGSWQAIARLGVADADGNTVQGLHLGLRTRDTIVRGTDEHLIVTLGVQDAIVVHTPDATLVANKHDEESIRQLVKMMEERGLSKYL